MSKAITKIKNKNKKKYRDCKRRTEVLVLFLVFSEDMSSLKIFISSSVFVTIDPGTSSVVASPSCLVELLLAIFLRRVDRFPFWLSRCRERKKSFYATPRTCSSAQSKEEPPAHFEKRRLFVFGF